MRSIGTGAWPLSTCDERSERSTFIDPDTVLIRRPPVAREALAPWERGSGSQWLLELYDEEEDEPVRVVIAGAEE